MGSSKVTFPRFPQRKFVIIRSQAASQSYSLCFDRTLSKNSAEFIGLSILKFFQYLSFPSAYDCSMMQLTIVSFYTICSLIIPKTAIFSPSSFGITLGIITPGVSIRYMRGLLRILNPPTPLVVQTEAEVFAWAFLFQRSEILLIWLIREDFPTLGVPQAMSQSPTCLYLNLQFSLRYARIFLISS